MAHRETRLRDLRPGQRATAARILAEGALKRRLFDMGITPGTEITMRKAAPFGDPLEITLRGYELTLRKAEAESIVVRL